MLMGRLAGPDRLANLSHAELPRARRRLGPRPPLDGFGQVSGMAGGSGPNLRRRVQWPVITAATIRPACWHVASSGVGRCARR